MLSLLTKPLSAITRGDIEALIDVAESQYLDFKEAPSPKGGAQRAEVSVTKEMWLTDAAKKELAKDVIAFANADGGILVLGIKETPDAPKRAREITQIPGCHELAERLERSLGDRIEPPVIGLQARGVEIEDGGGVVVIRVPASTTGPHAIRLDERPGLAVYVRRNDNARAATMRDIHDMVIDTAQSWQRAERILEERSKAALNRFSGSAEANTGYRITALPARARYEVRDLYMRERGNPDITWGNSMLMHIIVDGQNTLIKSHSEVRDFTYRPTLRGVSGGNGLDPDRHTITVSESGMVDLTSIRGQLNLNAGNILCNTVSAFKIADRIRSHAGASGAELLIDIEIFSNTDETSATRPDSNCIQIFLLPANRMSGVARNYAELRVPLRLPTYRIGPSEDLNPLMADIVRDLYNAAGRTCPIREILGIQI